MKLKKTKKKTNKYKSKKLIKTKRNNYDKKQPRRST